MMNAEDRSVLKFIKKRQECWPYLPACTAPGGVCSWGGLLLGVIRLNFLKQPNGNLVTLLSLNCHLDVQTQTQTKPEA